MTAAVEREEVKRVHGTVVHSTMPMKAPDEVVGLKVNEMAGAHIDPLNGAGSPSLAGRAEVKEAEELVKALEAQGANLQTATLEKPEPFVFLNLNPAWEILQLGILKEKDIEGQLDKQIKKIQGHQKNVDLLIKLNSALTSHKAGEEFTGDMKGLIAQLREQGIELLKEGEVNLSKEQITDLKSVVSSNTDNLRTAIQIAFTTEVQRATNDLSVVTDMLKKVIDYHNKLITAILRFMAGH